MKKIVGIGGGSMGIKKCDLEPQICEILRLSGKEKPHVLDLPHAQRLENQEASGAKAKTFFTSRFFCECEYLTSDQLDDRDLAAKMLEWADVVYEGGGNTLDMIARWKETGFDALLKEAWERGVVLSGISAGANCWFDGCSSDSLKIKYGPDQPLIGMDCLGFVPGFFVPHADEEGRAENIRDILKERGGVGLSFSNCAAIEIVDGAYRVLTSDASRYGFDAYARKTWWLDGVYRVEEIPADGAWREYAPLVKIPEASC